MITPWRKTVFYSGAAFNWSVGLSLLIAFPLAANILSLAPVPSASRVFVDMFAMLVIVFGFVFYLLGRDFARYRQFAVLGAVLKLGVVITTCLHAAMGYVSWRVPALTMVDLIYAALFLQIFREFGTGSSTERSS